MVGLLEKQNTGKAGGWTTLRKDFTAATKEEVLTERDAWLHKETHRKRAPPTKRAPSNNDAHDAEPPAQRPRRASCPASLKDEHADHARRGPVPGEGTAGPGRGHTFEYHIDIARYSFDDLPLPPPGVANKTWLEQHGLRLKWKTEYMQALEARCSDLEAKLYKANLCVRVTRSAISCGAQLTLAPVRSPSHAQLTLPPPPLCALCPQHQR